jgi:hypothetical protein
MMCLWASYKKKNMKKIIFASLNQRREESDLEFDLDPGPDPLVRGPGIRIRILLIHFLIQSVYIQTVGLPPTFKKRVQGELKFFTAET